MGDVPEATFNGFTKRLRPKENNQILPEYAGFYFRSAQFRSTIVSMASITTRASLNNGMLEQLSIIAPKIEEQLAIASVLSSLDDKIDLLHRQNKTLEAIAETMFRQWFVEEADDGWEEGKLGELFFISSGKSLKKEQFNDNGIYPVLGTNGKIGRTDNYLYDEKLIFTGRVGTLGNIFIVNNEKVWLSDNTLVIKPKKYFYSVYFILKTSKLEEYNVGSTQPLIRQSDIKEIEIFLPPEKTLIKFECNANILFLKIKFNKAQIHTLSSLRDTLLPKLMSGEVRVNV
ncbi:MAG: restriction endonuclease subunit S [Desulfobacterales bacterium]|nr:restriction endonuclease subunit S [Desulfobacterales bacterium]